MIKEGKYEFEDEAIGFIFPCHGLGMAKIVSNFINKNPEEIDERLSRIIADITN